VNEVKRIREVYRKRSDKSESDNKYSVLFSQQRRNEIFAAVNKAGLLSCDCRLLDVGCGCGDVLGCFSSFGYRPENTYGIDLLPERINEARRRYPHALFVIGSVDSLPFHREFFDVITQSTVFTSILDTQIKRRGASEMLRVLKPKGIIVWHDYRFDNPINRDARGIGKAEIRSLFPGCQIDFKLITLNPIIGRLVARMTLKLCRFMEGIPLLRTHWLATIRKTR